MADEVREVSQAEQAAQAKNAFPEGLSINDNFAPVDRSEYFKLEEAGKEFVSQYGAADFASFFMRVGTDGVFAQQVIRNILTGEKGVAVGMHPNSPQENNITGRVDHKDPMLPKEKLESDTDNLPVVKA